MVLLLVATSGVLHKREVQAELQVPVPPAFLSCEGEGYSSEWKILKAQLQRLAHGPRLLQESAIHDSRLQAISAERREACTSAATDFVAGWNHVYWQVRRAAMRGEPSGLALEVDDGTPVTAQFGMWLGFHRSTVVSGDDFCLCGCAAALWVGGIRGRKGDNEQEGLAMLRLAALLVGTAVPWSLDSPFRWGDAFAPAFGSFGGWTRPTADEICDGLTYFLPGQEPERHQVPEPADKAWRLELQPFGAVSLFRVLQPCDHLRDACWV